MSYVNPFAQPSGYENRFLEEKQFQPDKKKTVRRIKSATESPHHDPVKRFQFFTTRRRSSLSDLSSKSKLPIASAQKPPEGEHNNKVKGIWSNMAGLKVTEIPNVEPDNEAILVKEFQRLWAFKSCRMKIKELSAAVHASENFDFLVDLERYHQLCSLKKEKEIMAEHNRIIEKYLSKNAPSKIHLECLSIDFMPITNQAFIMDGMKERFHVVENVTVRTLAQNLMNNSVYMVLKNIYLHT